MIDEHILAIKSINTEQIKKIANIIIEAYRKGNKVLIFGNGGSAADAQHFAAELTGRYLRDREPIPALALNTNISEITAISNDYGYENVFARQVEAHAFPGDVVIGISTSGNSPNVNNGLAVASDIGCITVGLIGKDGGKQGNYCNYAIIVNSESTPRIQEAHIFIIHTICEIVEGELFDEEGNFFG